MGCGGTKVASDVHHTAHAPADSDRYSGTRQRGDSATKRLADTQRSDSGVSVSDPTPPPPLPPPPQPQQQQPQNEENVGSATEPSQQDGHAEGDLTVQQTEQDGQANQSEPHDQEKVDHDQHGGQSQGHQELVLPGRPVDRPLKQDVHNRAYWDDVRSDVAVLITDLSSEGRSEGEVQYLTLLKHWQDKHSVSAPPSNSSHPGLCVDDIAVPLSADADTMRDWLVSWQPFDLEPDEKEAPDGAEPVMRIELGDAHEVFAATLRTYLAEGEGLDFQIEGEAAWHVMPDHVIRDEVMTPEQQKIHEARERRTDLHDEERMRSRREELAQYFVEEHELAPGVVLPFLQWADLLQQNQRALQALCDQQP